MKKRVRHNVFVLGMVFLLVATIPSLGAGPLLQGSLSGRADNTIQEADITGETDVPRTIDSDDPEIVDDAGDVWISRPKPLNFLVVYGIFGKESLDAIDVVSAWFYEDESEPGYLFTAVEVSDLIFIKEKCIYAMHWTYHDTAWSVGVHVNTNGAHIAFSAGESPSPREEVEGSFDLENNIVTFKIDKQVIGNPQPGDVLSETDAWTALRFRFDPLNFFLGGEIAKDWAGYGDNYVIQY